MEELLCKLFREDKHMGAYLDLEQLAFLADNGDIITPTQASQENPTPTAFQTDDLDVFCNVPKPIFKLQKLVNQLELLEEKLSQEDVNQKLLRSLSPE
nr:hypothetical protein [Tanacetum cinerariifolium]